MVDDFMVCVGGLVASGCFESVNARERPLRGSSDDGGEVVAIEINNVGGGEGCSKKMVRECRIYQEEDEEHEMEAPCGCNGTLKLAHRKCIQRWCNKMGNITCEICNQVSSPNYTLPSTRSNPEVMTIDMRQAWGPNINLQDPRFLALTAAGCPFLHSEYDEYVVANSGSLVCFHSVAAFLMFVLLIHQSLMITRDSGMIQESSAFFSFQVSLIRLVGFVLPCYVMACSCYAIQSHRRRQGLEEIK